MKQVTKKDYQDLHYRLLQAAHAAQNLREMLAMNCYGDVADVTEIYEVGALESALVELEGKFSHLWSR